MGMNKRKILFILRTSKTHGKGSKPQQIKISSKKQETQKMKVITNKKSLPCPYQILREYLTLRGPYTKVEETFFIFADGSAVTPQHMRLCLKTVLHRLGFDESLYSVHSLRIGHSHDLSDLGLSVETIKKLGRWKSNIVFRYLR